MIVLIPFATKLLTARGNPTLAALSRGTTSRVVTSGP
jgi:hypothetical protein